MLCFVVLCCVVLCVCVPPCRRWLRTHSRRTITLVNACNLEAEFNFDSLQDLDLDPEPVVLISAHPASGVLPPKGVYVGNPSAP